MHFFICFYVFLFDFVYLFLQIHMEEWDNLSHKKLNVDTYIEELLRTTSDLKIMQLFVI